MCRKSLDFSFRTVKLPSFRIKTLLFSVALVTFFVSLSEIVDSFELPFESFAGHLLASGSLVPTGFITSSMAGFGYAAVFVLMVLESASLPIPSEVVLPFAGYLVFKGSMDFALLALVSTAAGLTGSAVDYYLALRLGRPIIERFFRWTGAGPDQLDRAERWLSAKGFWTILVARFVPGLRSAISLPAGAIAMKFRTFAATTIVGSFGWSVLLIYLGYSAGNLWQTTSVRMSPLLIQAGLYSALFASIGYVAYYFSRVLRSGPSRSSAR